MSTLSNNAGAAEVLSPKARAIKDRCINEVGIVLAEVCARIAAEETTVAA
ncbi:hypothetical protein [Arthrobacter sp. JUb115]|nr:hypothetical protein [Arthrobacter sp. JUb115]TDU27066.1 hypothetical protein EDF61_104142 [Arthrobacter sp. JUb115]